MCRLMIRASSTSQATPNPKRSRLGNHKAQSKTNRANSEPAPPRTASATPCISSNRRARCCMACSRTMTGKLECGVRSAEERA